MPDFTGKEIATTVGGLLILAAFAALFVIAIFVWQGIVAVLRGVAVVSLLAPLVLGP